LEGGAFFKKRAGVNGLIGAGLGERQINLVEARGEGAGAEVGDSFQGDFKRILDLRGLEKQGSHEGALGVGFEEGVELVAARPLVLGELGQETV